MTDYSYNRLFSTHQFAVHWKFLFLLLVVWLLSLSPAYEWVRLLLSPMPSAVVGFILAFILFVRNRRTEWLYVIIFIVISEQIYVVNSSFIDEMILLVFSLKLLHQNKYRPLSKVTIVLILFLIACVGSAIINSVDLPVFIAGIRSYIQFSLLFLLLHCLKISLDDLQDLIKTILVCGIFFSLSAMVNFFLGNISLVGRSEGILSNPNALAGFLIFTLPVLWVHFSDRVGFDWLNTLRFRWVGIFSFLAFISTGSRSMITGLFLGLSLVVFVNPQEFRQKIKLFLFLLLIVTAGVIMTEGRVVERFMQLQSKAYMDAESNVRVYYTEQAGRLFEDNPLFGVGPGRYGGSVATIFPSPVYSQYGIRTPKDWAGIAQSDVFYPHLLAELGLVGTISFSLLFFFPLWRWLKGVISRQVNWTPLGASCAASMLALTIATIGGPYFELHLTALFYWLFMYALVLETTQQRRQQTTWSPSI